MAHQHLLTFDACPVSVVLDGFGDDALRGLGHFMVRVEGGRTDGDAYRVALTDGTTARRRKTGVPSSRRPWRREVHRDGEDLVVMPGGHVRLAPGRPVATMRLDAATAGTDGFVLTSLIEAALIHALAMSGRVVGHAAAFELDGTAVLVVGPTRAGKSTLSAVVLAAGGKVVSDDSVILGLDGDGAPHAGALRRDLWLREGGAGLLPDALRADLWETNVFGELRLGLERVAHPDCFRTTVGPDAIVLLRRDRRLKDFRLREISSADGLAGLILASSPLFLSHRYPVERGRCMPVLMNLVDRTPCFEVRMGRALVEDATTTLTRLVEETRR